MQNRLLAAQTSQTPSKVSSRVHYFEAVSRDAFGILIDLCIFRNPKWFSFRSFVQFSAVCLSNRVCA